MSTQTHNVLLTHNSVHTEYHSFSALTLVAG